MERKGYPNEVIMCKSNDAIDNDNYKLTNDWHHKRESSLGNYTKLMYRRSTKVYKYKVIYM